MPKIDISKVRVQMGAGRYPKQFHPPFLGREKQALGNAAGLTQFGVNLMRLQPGAMSSLRHWHEREDEFIYVLEGELTLIEETGETLLRAGDAAGFQGGVVNGHHLVNRSQRDAAFLVVGTRSPRERIHYSDEDLAYEYDGTSYTFTHRSGEPYAD